jgi:hypothetical protein
VVLKSASTISLQITYRDAILGDQVIDIVTNEPFAAGTHRFVPSFIMAQANKNILLSVSHSDDANPISITASIRRED